MNFLRSIVAMLLAVMLVTTSGAMAIARGQTKDAAGNIIICTGHGPMSIVVDAGGEPIGPAHICPDCALIAVDLPQVISQFVLLGDLVLTEFVASRRFEIAGNQVYAQNARGPPV